MRQAKRNGLPAFLLLVFVLAACAQPGLQPPALDADQLAIGAHEGINFLSPLGDGVPLSGNFDPDINMNIEIFVRSTNELVESFSVLDGHIRVTFDPDVEEQYHVDWNTGAADLPSGTIVRIEVRLPHAEAGMPACGEGVDLVRGCLAFVDVQLLHPRARRGGDSGGVDVDLVNGQTLPIRVYVDRSLEHSWRVFDGDVGEDEIAFVGSVASEAGFGVPSKTVVSGAIVSVAVTAEPRQPVNRTVIGPVIRLSIMREGLVLDSEEGLLVLVPPLEGVDIAAGDTVMALVRVLGASGEVVEFVAQYTMNFMPVRVDMSMLRAVEEWEGLPELVEIEVVPLFAAAASGSEAADDRGRSPISTQAVLPVIEHLSGLHRLGGSATSGSMEATCEELEHNAVSSFAAAFDAFDAQLVGSTDQALWTRSAGKRPLVLVHGYQGLGHASFELAKENASIAAGLCGWQAFITAFNEHPSLSGLFTLYTFGYDSVQNRISTNGEEFKQQLHGAFPDDAAYVIAHSMGGMITQNAVASGANIERLYSLGTPYRGSATIECTRATATHCLVAKNTIAHDALLKPFADAAVHMLQYPGALDLTFESAFEPHQVCSIAHVVWSLPTLSCPLRANIANPHLQTFNQNGPPRPETVTAFVGNTTTAFGLFDGTLWAWTENTENILSAAMSTLIRLRLGRYNDNIVSVGSGAFLDLEEETTLAYAQLGSLSGLSPFDEVVLAPCLDHDKLKTEKLVLLSAPSGGSCDKDLQLSPTVFAWLANDLLSRSGEASPVIASTVTTTGLPAGNWSAAIIHPSILSGAGSFIQVGDSAVLDPDGSFVLDLSDASPPPVELRTPSLPPGVVVEPPEVEGASFSLIVFDDANMNRQIDAGEALYILEDPDNTFGQGALNLDYADRGYTIQGLSETTAGTPVSWQVLAQSGWGRTIYRTVASGGTIEVTYSNVLSGLTLEPVAIGTVATAAIARPADDDGLNGLPLFGPR